MVERQAGDRSPLISEGTRFHQGKEGGQGLATAWGKTELRGQQSSTIEVRFHALVWAPSTFGTMDAMKDSNKGRMGRPYW